MAVEMWFKQTHYVRYYTITNAVLFRYLTSEKGIHNVLAKLL